jgi:hypothetical protein
MMPVLGNGAILLARSVSSAKVYRDLMAIESDPPVFGVFDQTVGGGEWIEQFDRQECIRRLESWPVHHNRPGQRLPYSATTELGQRWLIAQKM